MYVSNATLKSTYILRDDTSVIERSFHLYEGLTDWIARLKEFLNIYGLSLFRLDAEIMQ